MKYVCDVCGRVVDAEEIGSHKESIGACHGMPVSEERNDDCYCGGTFVEGVRCAICGDWYADEELYNGICGECLKDEATPENVLEFYAIDADDDEVGNTLYKMLYGCKGLYALIKKDIAERMQGVDETDKYNVRHAALRAFVMADKEDFADFLQNNINHKKQEERL